MTLPTAPDVIETRSHADAGQKVTEQVVVCSAPGCGFEMATKVTNTLKPGNVILNMARRRGWRIEGDGRKVRLCPAHTGRAKVISSEQVQDLATRFKAWLTESGPMQDLRRHALIDKLVELGLSKVTDARNKAHQQALLSLLNESPSQEPDMAKPNPERVAESLTLLPLSESLKLPSEAARAQRRKVFHEIEGCYAKSRYLEGFSDETIAKKLLVAVGMVTEVRETNFGPAGPDPRISELRKQVAALEARIVQIEEVALAIMEQAGTKGEELRHDIASLLDKINKLEGGL